MFLNDLSMAAEVVDLTQDEPVRIIRWLDSAARAVFCLTSFKLRLRMPAPPAGTQKSGKAGHIWRDRYAGGPHRQPARRCRLAAPPAPPPRARRACGPHQQPAQRVCWPQYGCNCGETGEQTATARSGRMAAAGAAVGAAGGLAAGAASCASTSATEPAGPTGGAAAAALAATEAASAGSARLGFSCQGSAAAGGGARGAAGAAAMLNLLRGRPGDDAQLW